jgi:uncharacterized protein (DUF58 family)
MVLTMISLEILKRIREIEISTRRALNGSQVGGYSTAQKGSGFEFDQIREYQYGDDVRFIDWKSSARSQKTLVKQYLEERNRTIMIGVDVSASMLFGSSELLKIEHAQQVAAIIALVAESGKDRVGLILFSDIIEAVIPPSRGRKHTDRLLAELFTCTAKHKKTDARIFFNHPLIKNRKRELVFVLSDFFTDGFETSLSAVARYKEMVFVRCTDVREQEPTSAGLLWMEDVETGESALVDTGMKNVKKVSSFIREHRELQSRLFKKYRADELALQSDQDLVKTIVKFFRKRLMY